MAEASDADVPPCRQLGVKPGDEDVGQVDKLFPTTDLFQHFVCFVFIEADLNALVRWVREAHHQIALSPSERPVKPRADLVKRIEVNVEVIEANERPLLCSANRAVEGMVQFR